MTCQDCAWEADNVFYGKTTHKKIKKINKEMRAQGRDLFGHEACIERGDHCTCQHQPVGLLINEEAMRHGRSS